VTGVMVEEKVFDDTRDKALIKAGTHFYCQGHLVARPKEEQSDDPRYCWSCCEFLSQEAESQNIRAAWVPKLTGGKGNEKPTPDRSQLAHPTAHTPSVKGDIIPDHISTPPTGQRPIMSTPKTPKTKGDKTTPLAMVKRRRGPKYKVLPVEKIKRLAKEEGMGSKRIAAQLEKEHGITISYKTIQRILNGQRMLEL
jgi:hypothetical protein